MTAPEGVLIREWSIDYGDEREAEPVIVPHAWRQDVSVSYEGPVRYRTHLEVPFGTNHLHFVAVSYAADVRVNGETIFHHEGLWDAFDVQLDRWAGQSVEMEVLVIKNGGPTYPVKEVASGFLPYVYASFGGIYGEVLLRHGVPAEPQSTPKTRVSVDGTKILVDGKPFYVRGILSWGWYPEVGHTNVDEATIRREVADLQRLGFNLIKFCLWVPPHRYLNVLRELGMEAWLELPLWNPSHDPVAQDRIAGELQRIVEQYRQHDNIILWTVGCELSESTLPETREYLTNMVRNLTGCPLVKDNSGGAEMYGGDLREFGTFNDFHPYCDTPFFAPVLDSLLPGPRQIMPTLLGETNDLDAHRDIAQIGNELPYWASSISELNDQGVRWQYDLPHVVNDNRFALYPDREKHRDLMESSRKMALFVRKTVSEMVRARDAVGGYVITGERDTPISSAGFFDDWGQLRFSEQECRTWNGPTVLFLIPTRHPKFEDGGNRVGWLDAQNLFAGRAFWRIGMSSEVDQSAGLLWTLSQNGRVIARGAEAFTDVQALVSAEVGQISIELEPGEYVLSVRFGSASNEWPIWVVAPYEGESSRCTVLTDSGTVAKPFWREATYEFLNESFWNSVPFKERWERLLPISPDRGLSAEAVAGGEVLLRRIDTRTYEETPMLIRHDNGFVTTLRPFGGLGSQPSSLRTNPAGVEFLRTLEALLP